MNYENIFKTLLECEDKIHDQLQNIEWWSTKGILGPRGEFCKDINEKDCINALGRLQKNIHKLSYYIEHGDKGVEKKYNDMIGSLQETKGVM